MKYDRPPLMYRIRHRLASLIYGCDIDSYIDEVHERGFGYGYAKAKREEFKAFRRANND